MMAAQEAALIAWLEGWFYGSVHDIRAYILAAFGIHHTHLGCVKLLAHLGFEYRKPRVVPRKQSITPPLHIYRRLDNGPCAV